MKWMVSVSLQGPNGQIAVVEIPACIVRAARQLPHDPARYFDCDNETILLALPSLVRTRLQLTSVKNAINYMADAYHGRRARRAPISIAPLNEGAFLVVDGNST